MSAQVDDHQVAGDRIALRSGVTWLAAESGRRGLLKEQRELSRVAVAFADRNRVRCWPGLGHLPAFRRAPLATLRTMADEPVRPIQLGPHRLTLVNDPDLIAAANAEPALVKSPFYGSLALALGDGVFMASPSDARRQRRPMTAAMRGGFDDCAPFVADAANSAINRWRAAGTFDLGEEGQIYALDVVFRLLTSAPIDIILARTMRMNLDRLLRQAHRETWAICGPLARGQRRAATRASAALRQVAQTVASGAFGVGPCLAALQAAHGDGSLIVDEILNLLLAGHETTGSSVAFAAAFAFNHGEPIADESVALRASLETLRLRPPLWVFSRIAAAPLTLEGAQRRVAFAEGDLAMFSPWAAHRAARWPDPDDYEPDRWRDLSPREETRRGRYFPFGVGARSCVGDRIALAEMSELLLRLDGNRFATQPYRIAPGMTLRPTGLNACLA